MLRAVDVALAEQLAGREDLADQIRKELCKREVVQLQCEKRAEARKLKKSEEVVVAAA
jgi:hypothetical protein